MTNTTMEIRWGDIVLVDFGEGTGSEQGGIRPALVIQNDKGNTYSPTIIVCKITSQNKKWLPTHVEVAPYESGLLKPSTILMEQVCTIDKSRIIKSCGYLRGNFLINKVKKALTISFGMVYNGSGFNNETTMYS